MRLVGVFNIKGLRLTLTADVQPEDRVSKNKVEKMKVALRGLGMSEDIEIRGGE